MPHAIVAGSCQETLPTLNSAGCTCIWQCSPGVVAVLFALVVVLPAPAAAAAAGAAAALPPAAGVLSFVTAGVSAGTTAGAAAVVGVVDFSSVTALLQLPSPTTFSPRQAATHLLLLVTPLSVQTGAYIIGQTHASGFAGVMGASVGASVGGAGTVGAGGGVAGLAACVGGVAWMGCSAGCEGLQTPLLATAMPAQSASHAEG